MKDEEKTREQLIAELVKMRQRTSELERKEAEHKRAKEEVKRVSDLFQSIISSAGDAIIHMDAEERIVIWNPAAERLFGYTREEASGAFVRSLIVPEHKEEESKGLLKELKRGKGATNMETERIKKDGSTIWVSISNSPLFDNNGRYIGNTAIYKDITDRKRAEETLRESEERYRILFESSRDAIGFPTKEGNFIEVNQSWLDLFGYTREEMMESKVQDIYANPNDRPRLVQEIEEQGSVKDYEIKVRKKDGTEMDCLITSTVRRADDGSVIGYQSILRDITEEKRLQREIMGTKEFLENLISNAGDAIVCINREGILTHWNPAAEKLYGYTEREALGRHFLDLIVPDGKEGEAEELFQFPKDGEVLRDFETQRRRKDGSLVWVSITNAPIFDKAGEWLGNIGIHKNVSERKQAEETLRASEERYRNLIEGSIQGIIIHRDFKPLFVNQAYADIFGYESPDEILRMDTILLLIPPHEHHRIIEYKNARMKGERAPTQFEFRGVKKDGSLIWLDIIATVVNWDGAPAIQGTVFDITERKRADEALRQAEARYRNLFDSVPVGLYRSTPAGKLTDVNPATAQMLGYPEPAALLKVNPVELYLDPKERKRWQTLLEREGVVENFETRFRRLDGKVIWVSNSARAIRDANGQVLFYEGSIEDITERKQTEEELRRNLEKLRKITSGTIQAMALTVESRDPYTAGHQKRVADLARTIANEMGLSEYQIDGIRMAGQIHDIGKISIPAEILSKPGTLNGMELGIIKTHPEVGYDILKEIDFPWPVARIILQHQERLDGSGYPLSLSGEDILVEARVLAVADVVEAMASHRPYRPAHSIDEALDEISKNKGILYDPDVVDACLRLSARRGFKLE